ncbi:hypothetical protein HII28_19435 [Planctomonas sp. JC2975]|uniref:hypothetical protein n=1 Tax=Planctomonas sp. JC2975 TaxID=2729626 RepID=UPI001473ED5F|nr:hypothetical protein [Planctomonas sp. JC2975]NNC14037.1 hypothetical protein [Planctomonas sp. JC2975]
MNTSEVVSMVLRCLVGLLLVAGGILLIVFSRRITRLVTWMTGIEPGKPVPFGYRSNSVGGWVLGGIAAIVIGGWSVWAALLPLFAAGH